MRTHALQITYEDSHQYSPLMMDYISGKPILDGTYNLAPKRENWHSIIDQGHSHVDRELLVSVLLSQYSDIDDENIKTQIETLTQPHTFSICSAHQPLIFSGHAYFFYKIFHTVVLCRELKESFPQNHFVPIFYIGSEDADWDEIGEIQILQNKYKWNGHQNKISGRAVIDESFMTIQEEILNQLKDEPFIEDLRIALDYAYRIGDTLAHATRRLVHHFLGTQGVICIDADNAEFKKKISDLIHLDLLEHKTNQVIEPTLALLHNHYKVQANPQEFNFFWIHDDERIKIKSDPNGWKMSNGMKIPTDDIPAFVESHMTEFSPNVIYRPLYQESILPNLFFVGGGGECAYWLQLKALFDLTSRTYPSITLRQSMGIVSQEWYDSLENSGMNINDIFLSKSSWISKHILSKGLDESYYNYKTNFALDAQTYINNVSSTLPLSENQNRYFQKSIEELQNHIEKKIKKHLILQNREAIKQYDDLRSTILPNDQLQERVESFITFIARYGNSIIPAMMDSMNLENKIVEVVTDL